MLKASQKRMKRAALSEASTSRLPARNMGWLATNPTGLPSSRPNPVTRLRANRRLSSRNSPPSTTNWITLTMS